MHVKVMFLATFFDVFQIYFSQINFELTYGYMATAIESPETLFLCLVYIREKQNAQFFSIQPALSNQISGNSR